MRNRAICYCVFFLAYFSTAISHAQVSVITYIAEVPLVIESNLFVDSLTENKIFHGLSGRIRVSLAPRRTALISDMYVRAGKPLPVEQMNRLEYRIVFNTRPENRWQPVILLRKETATFPYAGVLIDTVLPAGEQVYLQVRFRNTGSMVQQNIFKRIALLPSVARYRQKNLYDSTDNRIRSGAGKNEKERWPGFDTLQQRSISLLPGKYLELVLKNHSLNKDSCIRYRLYKTSAAPDTLWKRTGHLLALTGIDAKNEYTLDLKYEGTDAYDSYRIDVHPFWYQTSAAMVVFSMAALFSLLGIPWLVYRYFLRREKRKRMRLQEQLKTVQHQLNPHFVYNALNSIAALVTNKENEKANEYLSSFSDIMRETLRISDRLFVPLTDDITMLKKYLHIEQLRFDFRFVLEIDPGLDTGAIEFPPMLLQPSVENAVKHGVSGMGKDGVIKLSFQKLGNDLLIAIEDNGHYAPAKQPDGKGKGIPFTNERINGLRELYKNQKIAYAVTSSQEGTVAAFRFENWIGS